jgi:hypothetical protein
MPTLERKVLRGRHEDRLGGVSAIQDGVRDRTTVSKRADATSHCASAAYLEAMQAKDWPRLAHLS